LGEYNQNTFVSITAIPAEVYIFIGWTGNSNPTEVISTPIMNLGSKDNNNIFYIFCINKLQIVISAGGTTSKNRNIFINKALRFFYCLIGNILATNFMVIVRSIT